MYFNFLNTFSQAMIHWRNEIYKCEIDDSFELVLKLLGAWEVPVQAQLQTQSMKSIIIHASTQRSQVILTSSSL